MATYLLFVCLIKNNQHDESYQTNDYYSNQH